MKDDYHKVNEMIDDVLRRVEEKIEREKMAQLKYDIDKILRRLRQAEVDMNINVD